MDNNLDNIAGNPHGEKEIAAFRDFVLDNELTDCWRHLHPGEKDFSWSRVSNRVVNNINSLVFTARRLDYFFIDHSVKPFLLNCDMTHVSSTDHKAVVLSIKTDNFPRGKGIWKLNESLLEDDFFVEKMSDFIQSHLKELEGDKDLTKGEVWDLLKIGIRDECIEYSRNKSVLERNNNNFDEEIK